MTTRVGVIGLGAMGGAIAANLLAAGFPVTGYDLDPARAERLRQAGGAVAASAGEVADAGDVVLLSLPSVAAFDAVAVAPGGLLAGDLEGVVVVETSTLPVEAKERAVAPLGERGATLLDCPLSGTGHQAVSGDLVVMASGDPDAIARCAPVFEGFARAHHDVGPFGAGSRMKYVANHLVAIHNVAAAEALALARAGGLDLRRTLEVIADGAGTSRMLEVRGPKMLEGDYAPGIAVEVFEKDLDVIGAFAREQGVPTPLLDASRETYDEALAAGHGADDTACVWEIVRDRFLPRS